MLKRLVAAIHRFEDSPAAAMLGIGLLVVVIYAVLAMPEAGIGGAK